MDINKLELKFESNGKTIGVGKGKSFRLLSIEGIENAEGELFVSQNVMGDGSSIDNIRIKNRPIMVEAEYIGANKEVKRRELINFFNIHKVGSLVVDYGGKKYKIKYTPESFRSPIDNLYNPLKFLVDLYCPDPFFTDVVESKAEIAIWQPAFEFPLEIVQEGIETGYREPSLIVNIFNQGAVESGVTIKFKALATLKNPGLFNVNTREFFKINKTMEAGEIITVTTHFRNKRVELNKKNTVSNAFNWIDLDSTFLQLEPGDNLFRYDADEGLDNLEVDIYYSQQYLGV